MRRRRLARWAGALALLPWAASCGEAPELSIRGTPSEGLVFVRWEAGASDLFRVRLADGAVRRLLETPEHDEAWPYWSAAAGRLVFQSRPRAGPDDYRLLLLDPAAEAEPRVEPLLAKRALREHWPVWSPDGARIAYVFSGRQGATPGAGLGVVDLATREVAVLAPSRVARFYRPAFSGDGRSLVAQRAASRSDSRLWILEPGSEPRRATRDPASFEQKGRFTRDGRWLLYTRRRERDAPGDIVVVPAEGGESRPVVAGPGSDDHTPDPSPVRDELAFISSRSGNPDAYLVPLAGGAPRPLTRTPDREENAPHWSPDGRYVVLTVRPLDWRTRQDRRDDTHLVVVDREGRLVLETPGMMPDWMPPW